jgi:YHS domain-containing protein
MPRQNTQQNTGLALAPIMSRRTVLAAGLAAGTAALFAGHTLRAQASEGRQYTGFSSGLAVDGYDPVAYFTESKPVKGDPTITHRWNGATWNFASAENRDLFVADPERYAPQYDGHCAWAAADGKPAKGDPDHWKIVDGKLYLNYNGRIQRRWEGDIAGFISRADQTWPGVSLN